MAEFVLLPAPKKLVVTEGRISLNSPVVVSYAPGKQRAAEYLVEKLRTEFLLIAQALPLTTKVKPTVKIIDAKLKDQAYNLAITPKQVVIESNDAAGAFYGACTLIQILRKNPPEIECCKIEDEPDFPTRGLMLDISRDKVPTQETLYQLVDMLAEWKINHFELYIEHTFAYSDHQEVWAQSSPMTPEEIRQLDTYCRERFIELVPNQNSFGHLHRWLQLPRYADLAEAPSGSETPWGFSIRSAFSLCPIDPKSVSFLAELFDEFLPNFTSTKFNVGCDETFDLGQGRSKEACEKEGKGRVYLDFLKKINELVSQRGSKMHFWGDIILEHPELVPELPEGVVALDWGYTENHPYDKETLQFKEAGVPFYVCPGTNAWNSIGGMTAKCLANIENAVFNGKKNGAIGVLNTDWGDNGHWQTLPVSYLGYAVGAAYSWNFEANKKTNWAKALDLHAFHDAAGVMGRVAYELGNARYAMPTGMETDFPFYQLYVRTVEKGVPKGVTRTGLEHAQKRISEAIESIRNARMTSPDARIIVREFALAADMMDFACERGKQLIDGTLDSYASKRQNSTQLARILGEYRLLWLERNRVGGLQDSVKVIEERFKECIG
jgi:hypothetical protein